MAAIQRVWITAHLLSLALALALSLAVASPSAMATPKASSVSFPNNNQLVKDQNGHLLLRVNGQSTLKKISAAPGEILPMDESGWARLANQPNPPPANRRLTLVKVNGQSFFVSENGTAWKTHLDFDVLDAWSGTLVKFNDKIYILFSIVTNDGKGGTFIQYAEKQDKILTYDLSRYVFNYSKMGLLDASTTNGVVKLGNDVEVNLTTLEKETTLGEHVPGFISEEPPAAQKSHEKSASPSQTVKTLTVTIKQNPRQTSEQKSEPKQLVLKANGKFDNPFKAGSDRTADLDGRLREKVFGQDHLTKKLAEHYYGFEPGLPTVLLVTGPSGVGKTHLAGVFAEETFKDSKFFLEIDGTEYQAEIRSGSIEHHKLVGAPKGQQGAQKGKLTEWIKETEGNGVLVINEADKMHPDIWKRLMELFEHGKITDGDGDTHSVKKLFIILTSNRGATMMFPPDVAVWSQAEIERRLKNLDQNAIKNYYMTSTGANDKFKLPREIINRITEYLVAAPFFEDTVVRIARAAVEKFNTKLKSSFGVEVELDEAALRHLALAGFTSADDGRQINRQVAKYLQQIKLAIGAQWEELHSVKLHVSLAEDRPGHRVFIVTDGFNRLVAEAPGTGHSNPLADPLEVSRLTSLEQVITTRIIGQDSAVKSISQAVIAQRSDASRKRPVSIMLVGSTGTGKTEMGRALALGLYDSADRVAVISMGNIMNESNWNKVFGADPGYSGNEITREFESILLANPEGAVIVLDEVSNMGGNNKEMKAALFKKLYDLSEEGKWTSPITGKVFDLSKYVFVLTGNDGETLFQGVSADDLRLSIWNKNKAREKVRDLMLAAGVPEAFLNRMADVILMKPLLRKEIRGVITKLVSDRVKAFEKQHIGMKVTYGAQFIEQMADSFFTSDRGGRGIRSILEDRLPAVIAFALINSKLDLTNVNGVEIRLGLTDNQTHKPYRRAESPARKVDLLLDVVVNGQVIHREGVDATEFASTKPLMGPKEAQVTAYHEAGHAVVNDPAVSGERMANVTIEGGRSKGLVYLGYARYEPIPGLFANPTRETVVLLIARYYAGSLAQVMAGYEPDAGWGNDLKQIRTTARKAIIEWGFEPSLLGVSLNKEGEPVLTLNQQRILEKKTLELIEEGRQLAEKRLRENWGLVRAVTAELLLRGSINGARFDELAKKRVDLQKRYERRLNRNGEMCHAIFK
jgi:ATP-dependent Clp protease ATP-binding subunit ClpA